MEELAKRRRVAAPTEAAARRFSNMQQNGGAICWHFVGKGFCLLGKNCPLRHPEEVLNRCKKLPASAQPIPGRADPRGPLIPSGAGGPRAAAPAAPAAAADRPGALPPAPLAPVPSPTTGRGAPEAQAAALLKQATALRAPNSVSWLDVLAAEDDPGVPGVQGGAPTSAAPQRRGGPAAEPAVGAEADSLEGEGAADDDEALAEEAPRKQINADYAAALERVASNLQAVVHGRRQTAARAAQGFK